MFFKYHTYIQLRIFPRDPSRHRQSILTYYGPNTSLLRHTHSSITACMRFIPGDFIIIDYVSVFCVKCRLDIGMS